MHYLKEDKFLHALGLFNSLKMRLTLFNLRKYLKVIHLSESNLSFNPSEFDKSYESFELVKRLIFLEEKYNNNISNRLFVTLNHIFVYFLIYENFNSWHLNITDYYKNYNCDWRIIPFNQFVTNTSEEVNNIIINFLKISSNSSEFILLNELQSFFKKVDLSDLQQDNEKIDYLIKLLRYQLYLIFLPKSKILTVFEISKTPNSSELFLCKEGWAPLDLENFLIHYWKKLNKIPTGWFIVFNKKLCDSMQLNYVGCGVFFKPQKNEFYGDFIVEDVISNEKFKDNLWITKKEDLIKKTTDFEKKFFTQKCTAVIDLVESVNYLQSVKFTLNKDDLIFLESYFNIVKKEIGAEWKKMFFAVERDMETLVNLWEYDKIPPYGDKKNETLLKKDFLPTENHSKLVQNLEVINQLNFLIKNFTNSEVKFYYKYLIDRRTRIYPYSSLINYQNNRIVRAVTKLASTSSDVMYAYYKYFLANPKFLKHSIFAFQKLKKDALWGIIEFGREKYIELNSKKIVNFIMNTPFIDLSQFITFGRTILYIEHLYEIFYRVGSLLGKESLDDTILLGIEIIKKFLQTQDDQIVEFVFKYVKKERKFYEYLFFFKNFKKFWKSEDEWLDYCWYNDASSNVIQLILFKTFCFDSFLMEVSNIFSNKTEYKNIYDFIAKKITQEIGFEITGDVIKKIIMPGAYGQTKFTLKKNILEDFIDNPKWQDYLLNQTENFKDLDSWESEESEELENFSDLENSDKKETDFYSNSRKNNNIKKLEDSFLNNVTNSAWKILADLNFPIKDYLDLSLAVPQATEAYWFNYYQIPIIITKQRKYDYNTISKEKKQNYVVYTKISAIFNESKEYIAYLYKLYCLKKTKISKSFKPNKRSIKLFFLSINIEKTKNDFSELCEKSNKNYFKTKQKDVDNFEIFTDFIINYKSIWEKDDLVLKEQQIFLDKFSKRKNLRFYSNGVFYRGNVLNKIHSTYTKYIKKKTLKRHYIIDHSKWKRAAPPAFNHADDASILHKCVREFKKLDVPLTVIHDSIGTPAQYSLLSKLIFKNENIKYIHYLLKEDRYPFNILKLKFDQDKFEKKQYQGLEKKRISFIKNWEKNKNSFKENILLIEEGIIESEGFFN